MTKEEKEQMQKIIEEAEQLQKESKEIRTKLKELFFL